MRVVAIAPPSPTVAETDSETVVLSEAQLQLLAAICHRLNPDMPMAFGGAHVIRTLIERLDEAGIDLADAKSEEEIARVAANGLRKLRRRRP